VARSMKMRRSIPRVDEVDAADEERESPGRTAVGASRGTRSSLPRE
jgi:hypothetical protein